MTTLQEHIDRGTLIRNAWTGTDEQGRETACLLAALAPECGRMGRPEVCPAEVMPLWLACLTPELDDCGSDEAWPGMVRRYAALAARWHRLDAAAWRRIEYGFRADAIREAKSHTQDSSAIAACDRVIALCDAVAAGGSVNAAAFAAAARAAWSAQAAAWSAEAAAWSAEAWSAQAAAWSAQAAGRTAQAAGRTAWAAAETAWAAAETAEAAWAAWAAWDRMTIALLDRIEVECGKVDT